MPQNTDNYVLKCPEKLSNQPHDNRPNALATEVHIDQTDASVEVVGIDGIDPSSPISPYGVGIDANGVIDTTGLHVRPGETLTIRLRHKKNGKRLPLVYHWIYPTAVGNGGNQTLATLDEGVPGPGVAIADPLLEALLGAIGPFEGRTRRNER